MSQLPNINLTGSQQEAVEKIALWYKFWGNPKNHNQVFYLSGYAGTGKSTIVPFIIDAIGIEYSDCCFATYTGKAALVLKNKIGRKVSTIHSLCYKLVDDYQDKETQKVHMTWTIRDDSPVKESKLLILDEVSMVSKSMMEDLLKFNVKVLVLGDPFQLPPVDGDAYFHQNYQPDFMLTEIHRQALENPIIYLSKQVRECKDIDFGAYGDNVIKMHYHDVPEEYWKQADQVIVGTNKMRRTLNGWFRDLYGYTKLNSKFPVPGDKLICLKNKWEDGLVNGMILTANSKARVATDRESFILDFTSDEGVDFTGIKCSSSEVLGGIKLRTPYYEQKKMLNIDYGNAITCHKSQGSQYNDVIFVDEGFGRWMDDNTYYRHLYTAITRTVNNLVIAEQ